MNIKISESLKRAYAEGGKVTWNKGKKWNDESKKKMSLAKKGKKLSDEHRKNISLSLVGNTRNKGNSHTKEWKQNLSKRMKGVKYCLGKKHTQETKKRMSVAQMGHRGVRHTQETKNKLREIMLKSGRVPSFAGHHHTLESRLKISKSHKERKESNHLYKGGITLIERKLRTSFEYRQWRQDNFIRFNFTCQDCGQRGGKLHVHHKKSFSILVQEAKELLPLLDWYEACLVYSPLWDIENGLVLCEVCHGEKHKILNNLKGGK